MANNIGKEIVFVVIGNRDIEIKFTDMVEGPTDSYVGENSCVYAFSTLVQILLYT